MMYLFTEQPFPLFIGNTLRLMTTWVTARANKRMNNELKISTKEEYKRMKLNNWVNDMYFSWVWFPYQNGVFKNEPKLPGSVI